MKIITVPNLPKTCSSIDISFVNKEQVHYYYNLLKDVVQQHNCLGLALPQLGIDKQGFFIAQTQTLYLNTYLLTIDGIVESVEGCLSIPNHLYKVKRHTTISLDGYYYDGNNIRKLDYLIFDMPLSFVVQHEHDHLHGISIDQIGQLHDNKS